MGERTEISWTDHTFNPWWGCTNVSPGCDHCYAEAFAKRTGHDVWGKGGERRTFGDKHWAEPERWNRRAEADGVRRRVFCASMGDVFEDRRDLDGPRERLFALIERTAWLDWQLLTKRPEQVLRLAPPSWTRRTGWPPNAWVGASVEDQQRADLRVPRLLAVPAPVLFLSCEPLLGPVALRPSWLDANVCCDGCVLGAAPPALCRCGCHESGKVDWVIVGGESGPRRRSMGLAWAVGLRDQARQAGVPLWFKQDSGQRPGRRGGFVDEEAWPRQMPSAHRRASAL